jgi:tetratricopeptide (TPR) repeat protein
MRKKAWLAASALAALATSSVSRAPLSAEAAGGRNPVPTEARIRDLDIEFYRRRVERDPRSARDYTQLAGLYLQRARETAANADLLRAEQNARHSLSLRTGRNSAAFGVLASSLLSQHRFSEAHDIAQRLVAADSTSIAARGLLGETQFELGQYAAAGHTMGTLTMYRENLSVAPRLARWEELHGRPDRARQLLRAACDQAERDHGMPKEQLAWFHLRLGDLAFRNGHLGEAGAELSKGLQSAPRDYRVLGSLARLEASRHNWRRAITYGEQALGSALDPGTLGIVGDAYAATGDSSRAREYYHTMEVAVLQQPGPFHRAWSLFLLDHKREVPRVLEKVRQEIQIRRDIYGYDLLAWALHQSGDDHGARDPMARALSLGTQDAMLFYHAGMIARGLGENGLARAYLRTALKINPYWDPFQPDGARSLLVSLGAQ